MIQFQESSPLEITLLVEDAHSFSRPPDEESSCSRGFIWSESDPCSQRVWLSTLTTDVALTLDTRNASSAAPIFWHFTAKNELLELNYCSLDLPNQPSSQAPRATNWQFLPSWTAKGSPPIVSGSDPTAEHSLIHLRLGRSMATIKRWCRETSAAAIGILPRSASESFLASLYLLEEIGDRDRAVAIIVERFDDLLNEGRFWECSWILGQIDAESVSPPSLVALMVITKTAKNKLPMRSAFCERASAKMERELGAQRAAKLRAAYS